MKKHLVLRSLDKNPTVHHLILNELQGAIRLAIRGVAYELTEYHNITQPEADIISLTTVVREVVELADLPTLILHEMLIAIRISVENEHTDALAKTEKEGKTL